MKNKKNYKFIPLIGAFLLVMFIFVGSAFSNQKIHSEVEYQTIDTVDDTVEAISDAQVPLAAPQSVEAAELSAPVVDIAQEEVPVVRVDNREPASATPTPTPEPATESTATPTPELATESTATPTPEPATESTATPTPEAPAKLPSEPTDEPKAPAVEAPTPTPEEPTPTPFVPTPTPAEPTPSPTPAKAQKPADIKDTVAMAKYLFDAATEFWAVEKDFSGTTTRPVSTRVAASIGAGTAVDCPGGDKVRIDDKGISHDTYGIADHFRDYVDMPDLQYFKIYLSEKDYTVSKYGAREDVIGTYYQYGSERTTYMAEDEEDED